MNIVNGMDPHQAEGQRTSLCWVVLVRSGSLYTHDRSSGSSGAIHGFAVGNTTLLALH